RDAGALARASAAVSEGRGAAARQARAARAEGRGAPGRRAGRGAAARRLATAPSARLAVARRHRRLPLAARGAAGLAVRAGPRHGETGLGAEPRGSLAPRHLQKVSDTNFPRKG